MIITELMLSSAKKSKQTVVNGRKRKRMHSLKVADKSFGKAIKRRKLTGTVFRKKTKN